MTVKPIPDGYHTLTPFLVVEDVRQMIDFTIEAFGAEQKECFETKDGHITHAEVLMGDSHLMVSHAKEGFPALPTALYVYVEDTDAAYQKALAAGAESIMEPGDQFYGDRNAGVKDKAGNYWWIATHVEDVSPEELRKRAESFHG
jgi:uncharacterized glyoxalase superfamily protein PhnB